MAVQPQIVPQSGEQPARQEASATVARVWPSLRSSSSKCWMRVASPWQFDKKRVSGW